MAKAHSFKTRAAAGMAGVLLFSSALAPVAEANLWEDRRTAGRARSPEEPLADPAPPRPIRFAGTVPGPAWLGEIPATVGRIRDAQRVTDPRAPIVFLIQDAHQVYDAQRNIARLLDHVTAAADRENRGPVLVGLEGAAGALHIAPYRAHRARPGHDSVCDILLRRNFLSGPEFQAMTSANIPRYWGVETPALYVKNIRAYRDSLANRKALTNALAIHRQSLRAEKNRGLSPRLAALDRAIAAHQDGAPNTAEYVSLLTAGLSPQALEAQAPTVARFARALALEHTLDFAQIRRERTALLDTLTHTLDAGERRALRAAAEEHRAGRVGDGAYHAGLQRKQPGFSAFNRYVEYALLAEGLDQDRLARELDGLKTRAVQTAAVTPTQRALMEQAEDFRRVERLARFGLSPEEWAAFQARRVETYRELHRRSATTPWETLLAAPERFYTASDERNGALAANLLEQARQSGARVLVLVAGGFHTPGVSAALDKAGVAHVTLTPRVDERPAAGPSLDLFSPAPHPRSGPSHLAPPLLTAAPIFPPATARTPEDLKKFFALLSQILAALESAGTETSVDNFEKKVGAECEFLKRFFGGVESLEVIAAAPGEISFRAPDGREMTAGRLTVGRPAQPDDRKIGFFLRTGEAAYIRFTDDPTTIVSAPLASFPGSALEERETPSTVANGWRETLRLFMSDIENRPLSLKESYFFAALFMAVTGTAVSIHLHRMLPLLTAVFAAPWTWPAMAAVGVAMVTYLRIIKDTRPDVPPVNGNAPTLYQIIEESPNWEDIIGSPRRDNRGPDEPLAPGLVMDQNRLNWGAARCLDELGDKTPEGARPLLMDRLLRSFLLAQMNVGLLRGGFLENQAPFRAQLEMVREKILSALHPTGLVTRFLDDLARDVSDFTADDFLATQEYPRGTIRMIYVNDPHNIDMARDALKTVNVYSSARPGPGPNEFLLVLIEPAVLENLPPALANSIGQKTPSSRVKILVLNPNSRVRTEFEGRRTVHLAEAVKALDLNPAILNLSLDVTTSPTTTFTDFDSQGLNRAIEVRVWIWLLEGIALRRTQSLDEGIHRLARVFQNA